MAKNSPAFQFYPQDFLAGTLTLTTSELGVYIRLLCGMWIHGNELPYEYPKLARIAGISVDEFKESWNVIADKFTISGTKIRNERLDAVKRLQTVRATSGQIGGKQKAGRSQCELYAIASADGEHVKLGISHNSKARLKQIRSRHGDCRLLRFWTVADGLAAESVAHGLFAENRENGEWFKITEKQLDFIEESLVSKRLLVQPDTRSHKQPGSKPLKSEDRRMKNEDRRMKTEELPVEVEVCDALKDVVADWLRYKFERGETYKPTGLKAFVSRVNNLALEGKTESVLDQMQKAMSAGWVGWEHDDKSGGRNGKPQKGAGTSYLENSPLRKALEKNGQV